MQLISLSYQLKPGFPRALLYLGAAILFALAFWLTGLHLLFGMATGITFIYALTDAFFVIGVQSFTRRFEYDDDNLYMTHDDRETVIPLMSITELKAALGGGSSIRGSRFNYIIRYTDNGYKRETEITVYTQTGSLFNRFKTYLKKKNPDVRIGDSPFPSIWLFKNK